MKKILYVAVAATLLWTLPAGAGNKGKSTAPGQNKLQCFDGVSDNIGFSGTCTLKAKGAKGPATLDLSSSNPNGDYAGVYTLESTLYGQDLDDVTQMSYHYTASIDPQPGNLSYNIPIDTDADVNGDTEFYLFVDAFYCPGVDGVVDIVNDPNCGVWENGTIFYANWDAFVAAHPGAKIAQDNFVFIVAERTPLEPHAVYTVNNVKFGKAGK
jgi:hypothetical protein